MTNPTPDQSPVAEGELQERLRLVAGNWPEPEAAMFLSAAARLDHLEARNKELEMVVEKACDYLSMLPDEYAQKYERDAHTNLVNDLHVLNANPTGTMAEFDRAIEKVARLEAREKAGRELAKEVRDLYGIGGDSEHDVVDLLSTHWRRILTHLDGGSTNGTD